MQAWLLNFALADEVYVNVYQAVLRYMAPVLAFLLLLRVVKPLMTFRREPEIWAWLCLDDGKKLPITHWESVIGRSKRSDVVVDVPTVSRNHAVLTRYDDGTWSISDAGSKAGVLVNGERIDIAPLYEEDIISLGGVEMTLVPISRKQEIRLSQIRTKAAKAGDSILNAILLTIFQVLVCFSYLFQGDTQYLQNIFHSHPLPTEYPVDLLLF